MPVVIQVYFFDHIVSIGEVCHGVPGFVKMTPAIIEIQPVLQGQVMLQVLVAPTGDIEVLVTIAVNIDESRIRIGT